MTPNLNRTDPLSKPLAAIPQPAAGDIRGQLVTDHLPGPTTERLIGADVR